MRALTVALLALHAVVRPADIAVTMQARAVRPGELVVLTIDTRTPVTSVHVRAFDRDLVPFPIGTKTWRVLVGIDLATAPGTYKVNIDTLPASTQTVHPLVVAPRRFPTRTLTVDPAFVTPPPEVAERIAREARRLEEIWATTTPERLWQGGFVSPVLQSANSAFGSRSVFNGQPRSQHSGADFASPAGTPVKAPNSGRAVLAEDLYFAGGTVVLDHGHGLFSLFAHLSSIDTQQGALVAAGDVIGRVGATGRVTGPHLHWAVRVNGARIDPLSLLAVLGRTNNGKWEMGKGKWQWERAMGKGKSQLGDRRREPTATLGGSHANPDPRSPIPDP